MSTKQQICERVWETLRPRESSAIAGGDGIFETTYKNGVPGINAKALVRTVG